MIRAGTARECIGYSFLVKVNEFRVCLALDMYVPAYWTSDCIPPHLNHNFTSSQTTSVFWGIRCSVCVGYAQSHRRGVSFSVLESYRLKKYVRIV